MTTPTTTEPNTPATPATEPASPATPSTTAEPTSPPATVPGDGQGPGEGATDPATTTDPATDPATTEPAATDGAPETYAPFVLPDGIVLEGDRMTQAQEWFKGQGFSQQRAQDTIDTYIKFRVDEIQAERGLWAEQSEQEFGKDFAPIAEGAQRAMVTLEKARPGITARLDSTNLGNHPDVLWIVSKFGELTKERPLIGLGGDATTPEAPKPLAERMFGSNS